MNQAPQQGLFDDGLGFIDAESALRVIPEWPDPEKFPLNRPGETTGRKHRSEAVWRIT